MRVRSLLPALVLTVGVAGTVTTASGCDEETKATINKALGRYRAYDPKASGKDQIAAAVQQAKAENKRVLVQFGGNWCGFCQALDELIEQDATLRGLKSQYVTVHVDAGNNPDLNDVYGKPYDLGFPVLLVLDGEGRLLHTQASTDFQLPQAMGHDAGQVGAFLKRWAQPTG